VVNWSRLLLLRPRLVTPEDVERATGLRVLGAVPAKGPGDDPLAVQERPLDSTAEGFYRLRTTLERLGVGRDRNVMAVLSANAREGRSTVAANLALSLARQGRNAVLVCADMRGGGAEKLFRIDPSVPGLASVLEDDGLAVTSPLWSLLWWVAERLCVLAPGRPAASPAELLASPNFKKALAKLRENGAVIVLDTPPASWLADALLAAGAADGTILVTRAGQSRRGVVAKMVEDLRAQGLTPLGVVMVGTKRSGRRVRQHSEKVVASGQPSRAMAAARRARPARARRTARPSWPETGQVARPRPPHGHGQPSSLCIGGCCIRRGPIGGISWAFSCSACWRARWPCSLRSR
jgi:capsular exopolysaccharide synthesis family protein